MSDVSLFRMLADRGVPIDPAVIGRLVYERRRVAAALAHELRVFDASRVIVHPAIFEDAYMRVHDLPYWSEHPRDVGGIGDLRCCGLLVDSDPSLRLDEVRLRHEETLTP